MLKPAFLELILKRGNFTEACKCRCKTFFYPRLIFIFFEIFIQQNCMPVLCSNVSVSIYFQHVHVPKHGIVLLIKKKPKLYFDQPISQYPKFQLY